MTKAATETMHVIRLEAENYKRIRAVEIEPDGNLVVVHGKNGAGKSSVLDSIWAAIKNASAGKDNPDPIRHGETEARVRVDLGDVVVTRTWKAGKASKLTVHNSEGVSQKGPQKLLDSLVGRLSFDPMAFASLKESEQLAELLDLVELPFVPAELDARREAIFSNRRDVNRDAKKLEAQLAGMPKPEKGAPTEEVSLSALSELHAKAVRRAALVREVHAQSAAANSQLAAAKEALDAANVAVEAAQQRTEKMNAVLASEPLDAEAIKAQMDSAEDVNAAVRSSKERARVAEEAKKAAKASEELTKRLAEIDKEKADGLKAATFPVEGLGFSSSGVTFNGVPFSQCCASERLKVSVAMAMQLNPTIRVIRVTDGSLLDEDSMATLEEMAIEHDAQIWLEVVGEGESGVLIEDGQAVER